MEDVVERLVDRDRLDHVVIDEREGVAPQVLDVFQRGDDQVVDTDDAVTVLEQRFAEV